MKRPMELPGNCHLYGNFNNYYSFHESESRCNMFPSGFFRLVWEKLAKPRKFSMLDIGCNEGNLTIDLQERAAKELCDEGIEVIAIGVDIDGTLIERACQKVSSNKYVEFFQCDVMSNESCINEIMNERNILSFNVVSLFSITMWIHLINGDDGLTKFLGQTSILTKGVLVIEPQNSSSYKTARKRCRRLGIDTKNYFKTVTGQDIENRIREIIQENGTLKNYFAFGKDSWNRLLQGYSNIVDSQDIRDLCK